MACLSGQPHTCAHAPSSIPCDSPTSKQTPAYQQTSGGGTAFVIPPEFQDFPHHTPPDKQQFPRQTAGKIHRHEPRPKGKEPTRIPLQEQPRPCSPYPPQKSGSPPGFLPGATRFPTCMPTRAHTRMPFIAHTYTHIHTKRAGPPQSSVGAPRTKKGGDLLSRIAAQYHRRARA